MSIFQIVGLGLVTVFLTIVVKDIKKEIAIYIPVVAGIIIFLYLSSNIYSIIKLIQDMASKLGLNGSYLSIILKMIGIAFLAEFTADICRDSGENAIGNKVEFAGKVIILFLAVPIITGLLQTIIGLL